MKSFVIRMVKGHPILYRSAKKIYRAVKPAVPTPYRSNDFRIAYELENVEEMEQILAHYDHFRKDNMSLLILVKGNLLQIHELIRKYPGVQFLSLDYYKNYRKKIQLRNLIVMDVNGKLPEMTDYI